MHIELISTSCRCPQCDRPALAFRAFGLKKIECDPCATEQAARREAERIRKGPVAAWLANTPVNMRQKIDPGRLNPALLPAMSTDGFTGCALIGAPDSGKTRIAYWLLLKAAELGKRGMAVTHAEIRKAASQVNSGDPRRADAAHELLTACRRFPVLLIDDIGKGACTPTADEAFFDLVTYRRDHCMTTHWTANAGSAWLVQRFEADKGPSIVNRLAHLAKGHIYLAEAKRVRTVA